MTSDPRDGDPLRAKGTDRDPTERRRRYVPTPEDFDAMSAEAFEGYIERIGFADRIRDALAEPKPLPVAGHQGCARWWLLWLAVGAAFWAIVIALILASRAAPRSESQPVEAPVPPSQQVAPATVGALSGAPMTLVVPSWTMPVEPAHDGVGVRSSGDSRPAVLGRASEPIASMPAPLRGVATWCGPTPTQCQSWGGDAMLGAVPSFRFGDEPYMARVSRGEQSVVVKVVSFCACGDRHGQPTLIDLSPAAFEQLAPLSRGVVRVELARHPDDLRMMLEVRGDELYRP